MSRKRIVSLIASTTEMVCALGCEDQLAGVSHECDYPPSVKKFPQCTEPKFYIQGNSYEIDQRVKAILQEGVSVYRVFADKLRECRPDVILTQIQCEVCAVSEKDVKSAVCELIESRPQIVSLNTNTLDDLWTDIQKVADALEVSERGKELVGSLQKRMDVIAEKAQKLSQKPRVVFIEWIDPLMSCGNWMPTLIEKAGGINLLGTAGAHTALTSWDALKTADPDILVISPCGYDLKKTREEMPPLSSRSDWKNLKAVQTGQVYLADGNQFFNRPGPRLVESLEILAEIFHPDIFNFGHRAMGWETF